MAFFAHYTDNPAYAIETETLGHIDVLPLTVSRMEALGKIDEASGTEFVTSLLTAVGRRADGSEIDKEAAASLSDAEKEEFAGEFLEHNQHLFRGRITRRRKNEDGKIVISFEDGDIEQPREEAETASDYLLRVFKIELKKQDDRMRKIMEPYKNTLAAHKDLFTPSFVKALKETHSAQARLQDMITQMRPNLPHLAGNSARGVLKGSDTRPEIHLPQRHIPDLKHPENPIYDTNKNLREVVDRLDEMNNLAFQTAETVSSVSNSATNFLVAFGAASDNADRASRRAIQIAGAAIVVAVVSTVVQIGYAEWRSHQSQIVTDQTVSAVLNHLENMVAAQRANTQQLSDRIGDDNQIIADTLDQLSTAITEDNKDVADGLDQLSAAISDLADSLRTPVAMPPNPAAESESSEQQLD